jgi:adenylylsulfate kinase
MATNIVWHQHDVDKARRARAKDQKPVVLWLTGLSGSGKSTIANLLEKKLAEHGKHTYLLDGDNVRHGLCGDLTFSDKDRVENIRRIGEVSKLFVDAGTIVLTAFISPFKSERDYCRNLLEDGEFIEIFIDTPIEECEKRDPKGLYQKARQGDIKDFTGIDSPYDAPDNAEITLTFSGQSAEESAEQLFELLKQKGIVA